MEIIRDIESLMPSAKAACNAFLDECKSRGLPVRITETLRTEKRQAELYASGRTKPGKIVTWTMNSRHRTGLAWDICKNKRGEEYNDVSFFEECGKVADILGIVWGGNWKNRDMPHFEVSENWEDKRLKEIAELTKMVEKLQEERKLFHYTCDLPDWARETVQKLLDKGIYKGISEDNLNLSEDMMRILVILDRAGIFDR